MSNSSANDLRRLINEVDKMSRRGFLKGIAGTAASAATNPTISINTGSSPAAKSSAKTLADFIASTAKSRFADYPKHPATKGLVDFSIKAIQKLSSGWKPSHEDIAKIIARQEIAFDDIYGSGVEDPNYDIYDLVGSFGIDDDDMDDIYNKSFDYIDIARDLIRRSKSIKQIKFKKQRSAYVEETMDNIKDQLVPSDDTNSEIDVAGVIDQIDDEELKDVIINRVGKEGISLEELTPEQLERILNHINYDSEGNWYYDDSLSEPEHYTTSAEYEDFFNSMFDSQSSKISKKSNTDQEPKKSANTDFQYQDEPEDDDSEDEPEDDDSEQSNLKNKNFESNSDFIRHYLKIVESNNN